VIADLISGCPQLAQITAAAHRVVHGGSRFTGPAVIDSDVEAAIAAAAEYAPLHNQAGLDGVHAARRVLSAGIPQVAVFDTAFHHTIPLATAAYGGPFEWLEAGLRRYGFHGISHRYAAGAAARLLGRPVDELRLVTCHLGGGCSITAVDRGRSIDTTMGLTPLDGLIMTTRSGSVDPALVLHLIRGGATVDEVESVLEHQSGLAGLSGTSGDLREVIAARDDGSARAALAMDAFVHRIASGVGAMIAALGGLDGLVFTGGISENSPELRASVCRRFAFAGVHLDDAQNSAARPDAVLSRDGSPVAAVVIGAQEDQVIADECRAILGALQ
jgi:acetate kinase